MSAKKAGVIKAQDEELQQLRSTVTLMDSMSQDAFSAIASIATLALVCLESPAPYQRLNDIAKALETIRGKAQEGENCINSEAEEVGCNYTDEREERRWEAMRASEGRAA